MFLFVFFFLTEFSKVFDGFVLCWGDFNRFHRMFLGFLGVMWMLLGAFYIELSKGFRKFRSFPIFHGFSLVSFGLEKLVFALGLLSVISLKCLLLS